MERLADEYRLGADRLSERLVLLRRELRTARGETAFLLERRIETMRRELGDLRRIGGYLAGYYRQADGSGRREV
ncbi:MAG: hypothetical protein DBX66_00335 [Clostridiales bacterium]|uniref:Uncharacterized protein n=1 Tax=Harryflintia acetispora TaxID=1849041 RepID=A0A9X8ULL2_9FIRM|nr:MULTISPECIES: hypothetical protein [Oscillospiraceae]PWM41112.1 MAG: hypothetical protein DBX66_00335 [Clostridiales bacterium]RGB68966.1 hypothetical protein DW086_04380 [Harryflintia acetispora]TCL45178.1 hypothetical protein EDD78_101159 [Harryflintia acetispora]